MKKKTPKITAGDCVEMYDFLAGKGIRLHETTVQETYETAKRHGYKEPARFGKVGGGRWQPGWNFWLWAAMALILLYFVYVCFF